MHNIIICYMHNKIICYTCLPDLSMIFVGYYLATQVIITGYIGIYMGVFIIMMKRDHGPIKDINFGLNTSCIPTKVVQILCTCTTGIRDKNYADTTHHCLHVPTNFSSSAAD